MMCYLRLNKPGNTNLKLMYEDVYEIMRFSIHNFS